MTREQTVDCNFPKVIWRGRQVGRRCHLPIRMWRMIRWIFLSLFVLLFDLQINHALDRSWIIHRRHKFILYMAYIHSHDDRVLAAFVCCRFTPYLPLNSLQCILPCWRWWYVDCPSKYYYILLYGKTTWIARLTRYLILVILCGINVEFNLSISERHVSKTKRKFVHDRIKLRQPTSIGIISPRIRVNRWSHATPIRTKSTPSSVVDGQRNASIESKPVMKSSIKLIPKMHSTSQWKRAFWVETGYSKPAMSSQIE